MRGKPLLQSNDERLPAVVERLKAKSSSMIAESKALGFNHNGPLRYALRGLLGEQGFKELMAGRIKGRKTKCSFVPAPSASESEQS